ncbi:MAG: hypothetical protein IPG50_20650 [Myxococcales bacterium]|nr:hypothetical protein [Myxococcales bacterium]
MSHIRSLACLTRVAGCAGAAPEAASVPPSLPPRASATATPPPPAPTSPSTASSATADAPPAKPNATSEKASPRAALVTWLEAHMPSGGEVVDEADKPVGVVHVAKAGELYELIARAYVELTDIYLTADLHKELRKANKLPGPKNAAKAGERVVIPAIVPEAPKSADEERLGWPEDKVLKGVYVRGGPAASRLYF